MMMDQIDLVFEVEKEFNKLKKVWQKPIKLLDTESHELQLKSWLKYYASICGKTLEEINKECGFETSLYFNTSPIWKHVLPSYSEWRVIKNVIKAPDDFDEYFR